jgi:hypothetical protein
MNSKKFILYAQQSFLRSIAIFYFLAIYAAGCDQKSADDAAPNLLNGNELSYQLFSTSEFNISGKITFMERIDGTVEIVTELKNTSGAILHPVHIHEGSMSQNGQLLSVLNPVQGTKGTSSTILQSLMVNEAKPFLFAELSNFNGSVRIHLNDGSGQSTILAIANIGKNQNLLDSNFAICNDW